MNIAGACTRLRLATLAFAIVLGTAFMVSEAPAQNKMDERTAGTTYVIGYPDTTTNTFDSRFPNRMVETVQMFIYSAVDNEVNITSPAGYINRIRPRAQKFETVTLTSADNKAARPIVTDIGKVNNATFRIEAKYPVIVYCYYLTRYGAEAFTPIPVESWGLEYYAFAFPAEVPRDVQPGGETDYRAFNKMGPAEILIVSAFDDTRIIITPTSRTIWWNYPSMTATLKDGECYQVQSYADTFTANQGGDQPDIGGVYITANKPIGVVSGNTRSQLNPYEQAGLAKNSFKNLVIEWVPPTEQHGTYFCFLPCWDSRRITGQPGEKIDERRPGEYVRVFGTVHGYRTNGTVINGGNSSSFTVGEQEVFQDRIGAPVPVVYKTDTAAMAWKAPIAVTIFNGTTGSPGFLGASYSGYSTHGVEMVSREQWCRFAPYTAPVDPSQMEHFVNIVTDSTSRGKILDEYGNRVTFNRGAIAGTDLFWGSFTISPGLTQWFESTDSSAKFYAFVYGFWKGYELYRPGRAKKDDDKGSALAGGGKGDRLLHPSEYEENTAVSYSYPLAPSRIVLRPPDTLAIFDTLDCQELRVLVKAINQNPVGFRSIGLDAPTVNNAKLIFIDPNRASDVIGRTQAYFKVVPIDPLRNASATVIVKDRTGQIWKINYVYEAERVDINPSTIADFGEVTMNTCKDTVITITNPLAKSVKVESVSLFFRNQAFTIEEIAPSALPATLASGEKLTVKVRFCPLIENQLYGDTLKVKLGCTEVKLPLRGETVKPCIVVDDLNFGVFILGEDGPRTLPLDICNEGRGRITFRNPSGGQVLEWLIANFSVPQSTIDSLRDFVVLGPNECFTIYVTFTPTTIGPFRTTAKFWSSTDCRRDTSVWQAIVTRPGPQITGYDWQKRWLVPDPLNCTKNTVRQYEWTVYAYNTGNSPFKVKSIALVGPDADAGIFTLDSSDPANHPFITIGQVVNPVNPPDTPKITQRVFFFPREERTYSCEIMLISELGDTARNLLLGTGIEPHTEISGFDFGTNEWTPGLTVNGWVTLKALPTRALTVTDIVTTDPANFVIDKTTITPPLPRTLQPGDTLGVAVRFTPQAAGQVTAPIRVIGDHSNCDNDSNQLVGFTYTVGFEIAGYDFGSLLTCFDNNGTVIVTNTSNVDLVINNFQLSGAYFSWVDAPALGDTIKANGSRTYIVNYAPTAAGPHTATVTVELVNPESGLSAGTKTAQLTGEGRILVVNTDIANNYAAYPGSTLKIPLTLSNDLADAEISEVYITLYWNSGMMSLMNVNQMTQGSLLQGWTVDIQKLTPDTFAIRFTAPPGQFLRGVGNLLNMDFLTFIGSVTTTDIVQKVEAPNKPCVVINDDPGAARVDSVCGLNFRLIELTSNSYTLDQNKPNPFNPSTEITFELGLDGPTTLTVYNELGQPVAKLVDQHLPAGRYAVTWNATGYSSGLYYYRLSSGHWTKLNTMILKK